MRYQLRTLIALVSVFVLGLGVVNLLYPFNSLRYGDKCEITDALSYPYNDRILLHLRQAFSGKLDCIWRSPTSELSMGRATDCKFDAIWTNSPDLPDARELTICDCISAEGSYTNEAKYVSEMPSLEKLKSFTAIGQYVELFGPEGAFIDGTGYNWQVFSIESEDEIKVMTVYIRDRRDNSPPRTVVYYGTLEAVN